LAIALAAFTVGRAEPLPAPELPPAFDGETAGQLAAELARRFPDRTPGTKGAREAALWVAERFVDLGLEPLASSFSAELPEIGRRTLVNVAAVVAGDSRQTIVVMAHRDNLGLSPGANDNASGTGVLLELARNVAGPGTGRESAAGHTLVFLSTDGGAWGNAGVAQLAEHPADVTRLAGPDAAVVAILNLDALGGTSGARLEFAGEAPRSPSAALVATARASVLGQTGTPPRRPGIVAQIVDLAFPFSLYDQGPAVARGLSAVTLTTAGSRPPKSEGDTVKALDGARLERLGRSAQALLISLDQAAEVAQGTESYLWVGSRIVHGWAIQLVLLLMLLPFVASVVDLLARTLRRGIPVAPAFRSLRVRLTVCAFAAGVLALFTATGILPNGPARPIPPDSELATDWPVLALVAVVAVALGGWLAARRPLLPLRRATPAEEVAGHLAAMLLLGAVAIAVAAVNAYALVFVLPSLHAWLWLPQLAGRQAGVKLAVFLAGFAGPALLLLSFAVRFDLGLDAIWYAIALVSVGYVPVTLALALAAWWAAALQVGALVAGRYAAYPDAAGRPLGPIRREIRRRVLARRRPPSPGEPPGLEPEQPYAPISR
jgi:hypothetical protein